MPEPTTNRAAEQPHSPTPWRLSYDDYKHGRFIEDATGDLVCIAALTRDGGHMSTHNAHFIVAAVNSFRSDSE